MKGAFQYAVLSFALNLGATFLIFLSVGLLSSGSIFEWFFDFMLIIPAFLFLQLLAGIMCIAGDTKKTRNIGTGMALTAGILLLITLLIFCL